MAVRLGRSPSQLLMPLAFAAHAGSLLVLTGTPVNVIVSESAGEAGVGTIGYFEFALVGLPLLVGHDRDRRPVRRAAAAARAAPACCRATSATTPARSSTSTSSSADGRRRC